MAAERPDLIITDLYLPDMNAVDATVILKQDPATAGIPIVVLTAMTAGEWNEKHRALSAGAEEILYKPFQFPMLRDVLRAYLLA